MMDYERIHGVFYNDILCISYIGFNSIKILFSSLGFANECMDLHFGEIHLANLGDGDGKKDQQFLMREYYMPVIGTCVESLIGTFLCLLFHIT